MPLFLGQQEKVEPARETELEGETSQIGGDGGQCKGAAQRERLMAMKS